MRKQVQKVARRKRALVIYTAITADGKTSVDRARELAGDKRRVLIISTQDAVVMNYSGQFTKDQFKTKPLV